MANDGERQQCQRGNIAGLLFWEKRAFELDLKEIGRNPERISFGGKGEGHSMQPEDSRGSRPKNRVNE